MPLTLLLHGRHAAQPVTYQALGQWLVPWRFDAFEAEHATLRTGVGLIDYSTQALIEVRGADRVSFLHALLSNDVKPLIPGGGCRAALLDPSAKLLAQLLVLVDQEAIWLSCSLERAGLVMETLNRYLFSEAVSLTNHERRWATLALQGPRTMERLREWIGAPVTLSQPGDHAMATFQGVPIRLVRYSLTDEAGVLCVVGAEDALAVWESLTRRGPSVGLIPVGWDALNTARIEAGIPWFGLDMDATNLLPETGLEKILASDTKGCYVGQEIVARMETYGSPNKKLMGLVIDGDVVPEAGDPIARDGETLGQVTSACRSPTLRRPIAMGYVKRGAYEPGTAVEIVRGSDRLRATVTTRPLVPRTKSASSG